MLVLGNLKERGPLGVVLQVEPQLVCLGQRVEVAFGKLVEVVGTKSPEVGHLCGLFLWVVVGGFQVV
jgi:hypothetical protein